MAQPPRRKRRYPPSVERGRTGLMASAVLMGFVGCALLDELLLLQGAPKGGAPGLGMQVANDLHRWATDLRGGRLGLTAEHMLWVVTSLHLLTGGFLLVLDQIGGRSACVGAFKVAAPVVFVWGTGIAFLLSSYGHLSLCVGLGFGSLISVIFMIVGIVVGNELKAQEKAESEPDLTEERGDEPEEGGDEAPLEGDGEAGEEDDEGAEDADADGDEEVDPTRGG